MDGYAPLSVPFSDSDRSVIGWRRSARNLADGNPSLFQDARFDPASEPTRRSLAGCPLRFANLNPGNDAAAPTARRMACARSKN